MMLRSACRLIPQKGSSLTGVILRTDFPPATPCNPQLWGEIVRKSFELFHFTRYFLIRLMASLTCLSAVLALETVSANAQNLTTYTYQGSDFTVAQAPYTTSDFISGQLTTTSRIPANWGFAEFQQNVLTWSFSDGVNTWNSGDAQLVVFSAQTDSQGNITSWYLYIHGNASVDDILVSSNSAEGTGDYLHWTNSGGQLESAGGPPGSWSVSTPPATVSFGSENVGTPAPVQTLTYTFGASATLSGINILTLGVTGLDYSDGGSSTCALGTVYTAGQSCTVTVAFTPSAPGPRAGAVTLFEQGDNLPLITWYLSGLGEAGEVAIDPGTQSTLASISDSPPSVLYGLTAYGAGNLDFLYGLGGYVSQGTDPAFVTNLTVSSLVQSTAAAFPMNGQPDIGIAADGAGNLFVTGLPNISGLVPNGEAQDYFFVVPNENGTLNPTDAVTFTGSSLNVPQGVAVDSSGNVYLADTGNGRVLEFAAGGAAQTTVASGLSNPRGVAVDAAGNVYVACDTQVFEYPVGGGSAISLGSGYITPEGLAVDPSGAVYVADTGNARVVRIPAGGGSPSVLEFTGLTGPLGVTVDPFGNVFVTDLSQNVYELNRTLPAPLNFGTQNVGSTSAPQTVTVSNPGTGGLDITNITTSGDFAQTNNCGSGLAAGASCTLNVTFAPTTDGTRSGTLTITDNNNRVAGSTQTVSLSGTGTGTAPIAGVSPPSLTFSSQVVGTTSASQPVTLSNTGNATLTISNIATSANFGETNTCGGSVAASGSCTINVTFSPTATGTLTGTLTITDNSDGAAGSLQTVSLTGTGTAGVAGVSPPSLTFGSQSVGTTSASQPVTLSNTGSGALTIASITTSANFGETNTCGGSVAASGSCTINVTFSPTATGTLTGTLTITDNNNGVAGSMQTVSLSGTGTVGVAGVSPPSLTFGSQSVGTTSASQPVTLSNTGSGALTIASIATTANFGETNTCGGSVAASGSCTINVTFSPTATGTLTGTLTITDNNNGVAGSMQTVSLSGTGTAGVAGVSPPSLTFGNQSVGTTSASQPVTLSNTGNATLTIASIATTANFGETNTCRGSVAAGGACTINVTFSPTAIGAVNGTLTITDNSNGVAGSMQSVTLAGTGTGTGAGVSPSNLNFGNQAVGTTSTAQPVTFNNSGNVPLTISSVAVVGANPGDFAIKSNNCGSSLAANSSCTINVAFAPTSAGARAATLTITDNAPNSPQTVSLTGTGTAPVAGAAPASLTFGIQDVGTTSASQPVTLSNAGTGTLVITRIAATTNFGETDNCNGSIAAAAFCIINVTFSPTTAGPLSGTLNITDNSNGFAGSTQIVSLMGTGAVRAQAAPPTFSIPSGTYNSVQTVTISDATAGATIFYTTNGTAPTTSSTQYTGAITVNTTETIEAIATATGYATSAVAAANYIIALSQTITFGALPNKVLGSPPFTVSATASSGLPVSFASMTSSVCKTFGEHCHLGCGGRVHDPGDTGRQRDLRPCPTRQSKLPGDRGRATATDRKRPSLVHKWDELRLRTASAVGDQSR